MNVAQHSHSNRIRCSAVDKKFQEWICYGFVLNKQWCMYELNKKNAKEISIFLRIQPELTMFWWIVSHLNYPEIVLKEFSWGFKHGKRKISTEMEFFAKIDFFSFTKFFRFLATKGSRRSQNVVCELKHASNLHPSTWFSLHLN